MSNETRELAISSALIEKARTAAVSASLLTAELVAILEELRELKVNLSLELQAVRDQRVAEYWESRKLMEEIRETLTTVRYQFRQEAMLLHLIEPLKAGDAVNGEKKKDRGRAAQGAHAQAHGDAPH